MADKCALETHPDLGGCCCQCKYLMIDASHPMTDGGNVLTQRGWACAGFVFCEATPVVYSGWSEHGMCELFELIEHKYELPDEPTEPLFDLSVLFSGG